MPKVLYDVVAVRSFGEGEVFEIRESWEKIVDRCSPFIPIDDWSIEYERLDLM